MKKIYSQELYDTAKIHFNEPIIVNGLLGRLVGYGEDKYDCYFIIVTNHKGQEKFWQTCVGGYIFLDRLKGQNEVVMINNGDIWDDFLRLEREVPPRYKEFELVINHD